MPMPVSAVSAASLPPVDLSGLVWRAGQLAAARIATTPSGYAALDRALPGGGWPHGGLTELLLPQNGIGEMRLLQPALRRLPARRIALVAPPQGPQIAAWMQWGLTPDQLLWIRAGRSSDALWSAEQVLRNGSCTALLLWQERVRTEALRRLQLAAQAADMPCWVVRPAGVADMPSPAPLRLMLRVMPGGLQLEILKRRGPQAAQPIVLHWPPGTAVGIASYPRSPKELSHALLDRRLPVDAAATSAAPALV